MTAKAIFSIFGQVEVAAANLMVERGKATKLETDLIPPSVAFNELGQRAHFAISIKANDVPEFNKLIEDLYA